ncbi:MAG: hypothetical protein NPIRA04_28160 [Nitrospirales bacterium]|nr:MAG: hypothetical protein NPIRA04_28160 [Nitrospirales bacterium]
MQYSVGVNVLLGIAWMIVVGCGTSESNPPQDTQFAEETHQPGAKEAVETSRASLEEGRNEYVKVVEGQLHQLNDDHEKLVDRAHQARPGTQVQADLHKSLENLTGQSQKVQQQIDELKATKVEDWNALQSGMNQALEELTQSYDQALARYAS